MDDAEKPDEEDNHDDLPGWGHRAMPQDVDMELHAGEFLAMNDLMEPMEAEDNPALEANSSITLSMVPSDNSANTVASANGPMAQNVHALPDLNLEVVPNGPEIAPIQAQQQPLAAEIFIPLPVMENNVHLPVIQAQPVSDPSLDAVMHLSDPTHWDRQDDPMQFELMAHAQVTATSRVFGREPPIFTDDAQLKNFPVLTDIIETGGSMSQDIVVPHNGKSGSEEQRITVDADDEQLKNLPVLTDRTEPGGSMRQDIVVPDNGKKGNEEHMSTVDAGENTSSDMSAPPGIPIPAFVNQAHTICPDLLQNKEQDAEPVLREITTCNMTTEEALIGKEGAKVWKKHFAPSVDNKDVI